MIVCSAIALIAMLVHAILVCRERSQLQATIHAYNTQQSQV